MVGAGRHERRLALAQRDRLALDRELAFPFEHDIQLIVAVRALMVGLRRDEHVHADLEPGRRVDDLVPAARRLEPPSRRLHLNRIHARTLTGRAVYGCAR